MIQDAKRVQKLIFVDRNEEVSCGEKGDKHSFRLVESEATIVIL